MKNKKIIITLFFALILQMPSMANKSDSIKNLLLNLFSQLMVYPQEKLYVQTDRPHYLSGETVYFRAYLLHASTLETSEFSRYVYVELVSPINTVELRQQLRMEHGRLFYGTLTLPESLPDGNYRLRAYTRYMENMGEEFFFTRAIRVIDPNASKVSVNANFDFPSKDKLSLNLSFADSQTGEAKQPKKIIVNIAGTGDEKDLEKEIEPKDNQPVNIDFKLDKKVEKNYICVSYKDGNRSFSKYIAIPNSDNQPEITFYPEGGNIIAGSENRVAFKAFSSQGIPMSVAGKIVNSKDETLCNFKSVHEGMGSFYLTPHAGEVYFAQFEIDRKIHTIPLPAISTSGYSLNTTWEKDSLNIRLLSQPQNSTKNSYLIVHHQGIPSYFQACSFSNTSKKIEKAKFHNGVNHLMLLDSRFRVLSERLVFQNKTNEKAKITINTDKEQYGPRQPIALRIDLHEHSNDSLFSTLAVSVTDDNDVQLDTTTNIVAEMLLLSELRGHISNPAWYFGNTKETDEAADLLMLTHGWRRYHVEEALVNNIAKPTIEPEVSQSFSGLVKGKNKKPTEGIIQMQIVGYDFKEGIKVEKDGRYLFTNIEFPDNTAYQLLAVGKNKTIDVVIQPDVVSYPPTTLSAKEIHLEDLISKQYAEKNSKIGLENDFLEFAEKSKRKYVNEKGLRQIDLQEFTVEAKAKKKARTRIDNKTALSTFGSPDKWISPEELTDFPPSSIYDLFQRLPGVMSADDNGVNFGNGRNVSADDYVVLNGAPMTYRNLTYHINVMDIAQVEVYTDNAAKFLVATPSDSPSLLVLTTWTPELMQKFSNGKNLSANKNHLLFIPLGYQIPQEFYSPKYDKYQAENDTADLRSTIYWKPDVIIGQEQGASLKFYSADTEGSYSVVVEGIAPGRKLIYSRKKGLIKVTK